MRGTSSDGRCCSWWFYVGILVSLTASLVSHRVAWTFSWLFSSACSVFLLCSVDLLCNVGLCCMCACVFCMHACIYVRIYRCVNIRMNRAIVEYRWSKGCVQVNTNYVYKLCVQDTCVWVCMLHRVPVCIYDIYHMVHAGCICIHTHTHTHTHT